MRTESITLNIAAKPERVWAVMSDFENWPTWTPSVRSIRCLDSEPVRVGSCVLIRQPKFPPAVWKIRRLEPGRCFVWRSSLPGVAVDASHTITSMAGGSRVTLALDYHGWLGAVLARLTRGVTRRYLRLEATGLKTQSEAVTG